VNLQRAGVKGRGPSPAGGSHVVHFLVQRGGERERRATPETSGQQQFLTCGEEGKTAASAESDPKAATLTFTPPPKERKRRMAHDRY